MWRKTHRVEGTIAKFRFVVSSRKKHPGLIYKISSLQATLPFPRRDRPTESQSARPWKGFVCLSYKPFNFRTTFQFLSADARPFALYSIPRPPPSPSDTPCLLPCIPVIHIDARFRYFRFGDGLTLPVQNYRVPFAITCVRSRRELRLPVTMERNDSQRNIYIYICITVSSSPLLEKRLRKWALRKRFSF